MSHHRTPRRRLTPLPSLIALSAILVATALGLAACGGSSSTTTTTETTANAASTGTTTAGTSSSNTTSTGTSSTATSSTNSGASTTGASTTGTPPAARAARFAAVRTCLSKKGITLPQRAPGGFAGGGAQLPKGMSHAQYIEALKSCGSGFNGARFGKGGKGFHSTFGNPRFRAVLERFAACLRQHGVKISEPNTSGKGPVFPTKGINTGSPQFKAAAEDCRSTLLGALKSNKAHPGTSAG